MSTVTVSVVQNVSITRTVPSADTVAVGSAVAEVVSSLQTATGLDWGTLAVTVADDPAQ